MCRHRRLWRDAAVSAPTSDVCRVQNVQCRLWLRPRPRRTAQCAFVRSPCQRCPCLALNIANVIGQGT